MLSETFTPQFPVGLIDKDFRYALEVSGSADKTPVIATVHKVFQTGIEKGLGDLNMTSVAKLYGQDASKS
jgi:3-hydroxyisobutyrate dehydrogenase